jgi:hypothetical protein
MPRKSAVATKIDALPAETRDRVLERAAILWESGLSDDASNRAAYEMETGEALPGVARARRRGREADVKKPTGSDV